MTLKNRFRIVTIYLLRFLLHFFSLFPINKKKILFSSFGGLKIACNPFYVYLKLIETHPDEFKIIWVSTSKCDCRIREQDIIIPPKGICFLYHLLTAAVIIDNDGFKSYIPIRKKQLYINTWHGGGLFKTAYGASRSKEEIEYNAIIEKIKKGGVKLLLSTSELWTEVIARCRFNYLGEVLESGYPRNDILFSNNCNLSKKVKSSLNIDINDKIVLFAPTYRGGLFKRFDSDCVEGLNIGQLTDSLEKRFGGKFCLVYRGHHAARRDCAVRCIDATNYADMQELLAVADVFISDYSSCLWDFSLTNKPCFIFALDFDQYMIDPGFESDYHEWPFPIAKNNEELRSNILSFDIKDHKERISRYLIKYGSFEDGHASESVIKWIEQHL